jgi:hypothetical protein
MIWGAIGYGFKSELIFWDHKAHGKITGAGYLAYILPQVEKDFLALQFMEEGSAQWEFMQDNAPVHKTKAVLRWF